MQSISRTPPVVAIDRVEANVVRLQRRQLAARDEADDVATLSSLMERASNAARQMRYFSLASKQFSFEDLASSARRAGFLQIDVDPQVMEASFQWASGQPDLIFAISFRDAARISIVAESQADIFGLILTGYSDAASISVELKPTIEDRDLGHNALLFRDMLLTSSGFDDMPAWTKHPEGYIPETGGLVEMWRAGVSVASIFGRTWNSILPRVLAIWKLLREHWNTSR